MNFKHYRDNVKARKVFEDYKNDLGLFSNNDLYFGDNVQEILDTCETAEELDHSLNRLLMTGEFWTIREKPRRPIHTPLRDSGDDLPNTISSFGQFDDWQLRMQGSWDDGVRILEGDRR